MSNYMEEAMAPAEAKYRNAVMRDTWGHLAPKHRTWYKGHIVFAYAQNGDMTIVSDYLYDGKKVLDGSPWFFQQSNDWMADRCQNDKLEQGHVYHWEGCYMLFKNGTGFFTKGKLTMIA